MIFLIDRKVPVFENKKKIKKTKINRKGRNKKKETIPTSKTSIGKSTTCYNILIALLDNWTFNFIFSF